MSEQLKKHLLAQGLDEVAVSAALESYAEQTDDTEEEPLDVDLLVDAIDGLSKAMSKDKEEMKPSDEDSKEDEDDTQDEEDDEMEKGYSQDVMKGMEEAMSMMAKGTDSILADMEKRFDAIAKGLEAVLKNLVAMQEMKKSLTEKVEAQSERIENMSKALNVVQPPRAAQSAAVVAEPVVEMISTQDVINKALTRMRDEESPAIRAQLRSAVSRLECGVNPQEIIREFNL